MSTAQKEGLATGTMRRTAVQIRLCKYKFGSRTVSYNLPRRIDVGFNCDF